MIGIYKLFAVCKCVCVWVIVPFDGLAFCPAGTLLCAPSLLGSKIQVHRDPVKAMVLGVVIIVIIFALLCSAGILAQGICSA